MSGRSQEEVIGLVVPAFDKGGLEQVVYNLYRGYRGAGYDCVILVENNVTGYMSGQLDVVDDCYIFNGDEALFLKACRARGVTHLHYHYSIFGLALMTTLGFETIYTIHNVYTWLDREAFALHAEAILRATQVVAVSRFVRDYFCRRAGVPREKVIVVLNGTDVAQLDQADRIDRAALAIPTETFLFANLASFHRNKHHAVMIAAAERLMKTGADFMLLMVGNVGDPEYHREVDVLIERSPARAHLRQLPYVPAASIGSMYRDVIDAVVLASIQEGCSNVVLEALATGRPMVLTDVGNAREAAALSSRVVVVPPAYVDLQELQPSVIEELSRQGNTRNAEAVAEAMQFVLEARFPAAEGEELAAVRQRVDVSGMIASYLGLLFADDQSEVGPRPEPAARSTSSTTSSTAMSRIHEKS